MYFLHIKQSILFYNIKKIIKRLFHAKNAKRINKDIYADYFRSKFHILRMFMVKYLGVEKYG